jgi:hypothetical protein
MAWRHALQCGRPPRWPRGVAQDLVVPSAIPPPSPRRRSGGIDGLPNGLDTQCCGGSPVADLSSSTAGRPTTVSSFPSSTFPSISWPLLFILPHAATPDRRRKVMTCRAHTLATMQGVFWEILKYRSLHVCPKAIRAYIMAWYKLCKNCNITGILNQIEIV